MITLGLVETSGVFPTSIYEILLDGHRIGECQLRHRPSKNENLPDGFESHVYYEINPEFRGKGYAKQTLGLLLEQARAFGLKNLTIVASENNSASQKIIESVRGVLVARGTAGDGTEYRKYWVGLEA
jgi:predicted acetyltransferase